MTKTERDSVIDACIQRVLSLRDDAGLTADDRDHVAVVTVTGAACFRLLQLKAEPIAEPHCSWFEDEDGHWLTHCAHIFTFETAGPAENGMQFCCYCGQALAAQPMEAEA